MLSNLYGLVGTLVTRFHLEREEGQTMAEYAILVAVIALVVIIAAVFLGGKISSLFSSLGNGL